MPVLTAANRSQTQEQNPEEAARLEASTTTEPDNNIGLEALDLVSRSFDFLQEASSPVLDLLSGAPTNDPDQTTSALDSEVSPGTTTQLQTNSDPATSASQPQVQSSGFFSSITSFFGNTFSKASEFVTSKFDSVKDYFKSNFPGIYSIGESIVNFTEPLWRPVVNTVSSLVETTWQVVEQVSSWLDGSAPELINNPVAGREQSQENVEIRESTSSPSVVLTPEEAESILFLNPSDFFKAISASLVAFANGVKKQQEADAEQKAQDDALRQDAIQEERSRVAERVIAQLPLSEQISAEAGRVVERFRFDTAFQPDILAKDTPEDLLFALNLEKQHRETSEQQTIETEEAAALENEETKK